MAHRSILDDSTRRQFMSHAAKTFLGVSALPALGNIAHAAGETEKRKATAKRVIYLYMTGGMSHIDTFDPKPRQETQGPVEAIRTNVSDIRVTEYLPRMAQQMDKVCVINSLTSTQGAHAQGRYFMHTSYFLRGTIKHPSMGAWLNRMAGQTNPTLPGHVAIGSGQYMASGGFFESASQINKPLHIPRRILQSFVSKVHVTAIVRLD